MTADRDRVTAILTLADETRSELACGWPCEYATSLERGCAPNCRRSLAERLNDRSPQ